MDFEQDLLISYAHLDDQALIEGDTGWVSSLHRLLEIRVGQLLGEKPRIWRDPKLQGNDFFADTILERLPRVGALVSVLSPRYVKSEWCNRELTEFCRASQKSGGVRIADKARIFKVVKTPVPAERHPEEMQSFLGYEFYVVDPQSGRPRELAQSSYGPEAERAFLAKLDDLAYDITKLLELMRQNGDGDKTEVRRGTVYLAETSFDLRDEREAVKRDLIRNGYEVLPDQPLPLVTGDFAASVRAQLARCTLSIHLVGKNYGVVPEGETRSIIVLQHEIAAERSAADGLSRLIWLPPGLVVEDERQRELLGYLHTAPSVHAGAELLEVPLEDLKTLIYRQLAPPVSAKKAAPAAGKEISHVYLVCDQPDVEAARPLEDFLFDQGFEVSLPLFDDDEAQARLDHEESLCGCDAVLFFYGEAGEPWLRRKLRELQKSAGLGREKPLLARGIYVGNPLNPQKERFRTLEATVLREPADGFSSDVLAPFLAEIAQAQGQG
ncbi:MAG: hypothetical protein ACJ76J_09230 [Thermoanaerobaculia bacterium]